MLLPPGAEASVLAWDFVTVIWAFCGASHVSWEAESDIFRFQGDPSLISPDRFLLEAKAEVPFL